MYSIYGVTIGSTVAGRSIGGGEHDLRVRIMQKSVYCNKGHTLSIAPQVGHREAHSTMVPLPAVNNGDKKKQVHGWGPVCMYDIHTHFWQCDTPPPLATLPSLTSVAGPWSSSTFADHWCLGRLFRCQVFKKSFCHYWPILQLLTVNINDLFQVISVNPTSLPFTFCILSN